MPPGPVPLAVADALPEPDPEAELTGMEGRGKEEPVDPIVVVSVKEKVVGEREEAGAVEVKVETMEVEGIGETETLEALERETEDAVTVEVGAERVLSDTLSEDADSDGLVRAAIVNAASVLLRRVARRFGDEENISSQEKEREDVEQR